MTHAHSELFVNVASAIGERLISDAVWLDDDQCAWPVRDRAARPGFNAHNAPLMGGGLYAGTAGLALALGELYAVSSDSSLKRCALAAIRHSMSTIPSTFSYYVGGIGSAWVAARLSEIFDDERLASEASRLVERATVALCDDSALDVIGGSAGAIPALLSLHGRGYCPEGVDLAIRAGEHLERKAVRQVEGWSWPSAMLVARNLCGYGHGVSGFVHAFAELYVCTGDARWGHAAQRGLEYEAWCGPDEKGDWPDFRSMELIHLRELDASGLALRKRLASVVDPVRYSYGTMRAWCHGAPGIALVRLRATELGFSCAEEARLAVEATMAGFALACENGSLCHGALGNLEIFVDSGGVSVEVPTSAIEALASVLMRHARGEGRWRSGVPGGAPDSSLMLGDAGTVHGLLRLAGQGVPSVLFIRSAAAIQPFDDRTATEHRERDMESLLSRLVDYTAGTSAEQCVRSCLSDYVRDAAGPLSEVIPLVLGALDTRLPEHARVALKQDCAVLSAKSAYVDRIEHLGVMARAASPLRAETTHLHVLADSTALVSGASSDDGPWAELPAVLVYRAQHGIVVRTLTRAEERMLELLREPRGLDDVVAMLESEMDLAENTQGELRTTIAGLLAELRCAGITRTIQGNTWASQA